MKKYNEPSTWLIVTVIWAVLSSLTGGIWADNGSPVAFSFFVLLSFGTLGGFLQWYITISVERSSKVATQLILQDALKASRIKGAETKVAGALVDAAEQIAGTLVNQDQITADTLAEADRDVTRNVQQKNDE